MSAGRYHGGNAGLLDTGGIGNVVVLSRLRMCGRGDVSERLKSSSCCRGESWSQITGITSMTGHSAVLSESACLQETRLNGPATVVLCCLIG